MQRFAAVFLMASVLEFGGSSLAGAATATHFSCNPTNKTCQCSLDISGDCDAMKINCKDGTISSCGTLPPPYGNFCTCTMGRVGTLKDKLKGKLDNLPELVPQ